MHFCIPACLFATFLQEGLVGCVGLRATYLIGLLVFATSMLLTVIYPSVIVINVCAALSGLGTAVVMNIPASLITIYQKNPDDFYPDAKQLNGVGYNMAIIDSAYYLAQIVLSIFMGKVVDMTGLPHMYILTSSMCAFVSIALASRLPYSRPKDRGTS